MSVLVSTRRLKEASRDLLEQKLVSVREFVPLTQGLGSSHCRGWRPPDWVLGNRCGPGECMRYGKRPVASGSKGPIAPFKVRLSLNLSLICAACVAAEPALANDPCSFSLSTLTCSGNQSSGVLVVAPISPLTVNVERLTRDILPPAGSFGIWVIGDGSDGSRQVSGTSAKDLTLNIDASTRRIKTTYLPSVFVRSIGGDGGEGAVDVFFGYSQGLTGRYAGFGGEVTINSNINVTSSLTHGIFGFSSGGTGGQGGNANHIFKATGGDGRGGRSGDTVSVSSDGVVTTSGSAAFGVLAYSQGGHGGAGGRGGAVVGIGGDGGNAANAGSASATNNGVIRTSGTASFGLVTLSHGGDGGAGGYGAGISGTGGEGGFGGNGGRATAKNTGEIYTTGTMGHGIFGQSAGGVGGAGGGGGGIAGLPGNGAGTGDGGAVRIDQLGTISTGGIYAYGVLAQSVGGFGGSGGDGGGIYAAGGQGAEGGNGGEARIVSTGSVSTSGVGSHGLVGQSAGGGGGTGGATGGLVALGGAGSGGGNAGYVSVTNSGLITTLGHDARGIVAQSVGGGGGLGGSSGGIVAIGGAGSTASHGGRVYVSNRTGGNISTRGRASHGIFAESVGGGGGSAGDTGGLVAIGGTGSVGGNGGTVSVYNRAIVDTNGWDSKAIFAQSVGGGGGEAGDAGGVVYIGGAGNSGGNGGGVYVTNYSGGVVTTDGVASYGIFAQSVGGGGGAGGATGGLVALGGSGSSGGAGGTVRITNYADVTTTGYFGRGLFAQSVGGGGGDGGASGGFVSLGGHSAASSNAGAVTLRNYGGAVTVRGDFADGIFAQSVGGGGGTLGDSGGFISIGGDGAGGGSGGDVTVTNTGVVKTSGIVSRGVLAQSVGGGGGSGGASGGVVSVGGRGSSTGDGGAVTITNNASVTTRKQFSEAILAHCIGGGGGLGGASGGWVSFGGSGASGGNGGIVSVTNTAALTTRGRDASALFAQSVGGGGGNGGSTTAVGYMVSVGVGGGGGLGGDGGAVSINSSAGLVSTIGARSHGILGQSIGGSGGNGGYAVSVSANILGAIAVGVGGDAGGGGAGDNVDVINTSSVDTTGQDSLGIFAQSIGGSGGSGGYAIAVAVGGALPSIPIGIGGSGGAAGDAGGLVSVDSSEGSITTRGNRSTGILAQSVGGGGGNGGFAISSGVGVLAGAVSIGGEGGFGRTGGGVTVVNTSNVTTHGEDSNAVTAQSIGGGGGNGGYSIAASVNAGGGALSIGGGAGIGNSGGTVFLDNAGTLSTAMDGSLGLLAQSIGGGGGAGGYSIAGNVSVSAGMNLSLGGAGGDGGNGAASEIENKGGVTTLGGQSHGVVAQSIGGGGGSGGFSVKGSISGSIDIGVGIGGAGGVGARAGLARINNVGADISTSGDRSYGLVAQSIGGSGGEGGFSVSAGAAFFASASVGVGGAGGAGGQSGEARIVNDASVTTAGVMSHGVFVQSIGGGGGVGGFGASGSVSSVGAISVGVGGSGGSGGSVLGSVTATQSIGTIRTTGILSYGILAQSVGGQGGDGGISVAGNLSTTGATVGVGGTGGKGGSSGLVTVTRSGDLYTESDLSSGLIAQSLGGGGGTGGMSIKGALTSGIDVGVSIGGSGGKGGAAGKVKVDDNGGLISTLGDLSTGVIAQSIGGTGGNGGLSVAGGVTGFLGINTAIGGSGGNGSAGGIVDVNVASDITTEGIQSHGILAQSIGGSGGNGGMVIVASVSVAPPAAKLVGSLNVGVGGAGGNGGIADIVGVTASGEVTTKGDYSHGIFAQSIGGSGGDGGMSTVGAMNLGGKNSINANISIGGAGGNAAQSGDVSVTNEAVLLSTEGDYAMGIFAQSIGGSGGNGGMAINGFLELNKGEAKEAVNLNLAIDVGGKGGNGARGGAVHIVSTGQTLTTSGTMAHGIIAQSIGGSGGGSGSAYNESFSQSSPKGEGSGFNFGLAVGAKGGSSAVSSTVDIENWTAITTGGSDSHAIVGQSIGGSGGVGALTVSVGGGGDFPISGAADADVVSFGMNLEIGGRGPLGQAGAGGNADTVTIENLGPSITTSGGRSYGVLAQSIGGTGGNAGADTAPYDYYPGIPSDSVSLNVSVGGRGGAGGVAGNAFVTNDAAVTTSGDAAHGLVAQSVGGGGGAGGGLINGSLDLLGSVSATVGGPGGAGATARTARVTNNGLINTSGARSYGVLSQSIGGTGGEGGLVISNGISGGTLKVSVGGEGGIGGRSGVAIIDNEGNVTTQETGAHGLAAQSLGGGGGVGGAVIQGAASFASAVNIGIGGTGGAGGRSSLVDVDSVGAQITTSGDNANGIMAQSIAGTGGDGAFSVAGSVSAMPSLNIAIGGGGGGSSVAGKVDVFASGGIETGGTNSHGIQAQSIGGGGGSGGFSVAAGLSVGGTINFGVGGSGGASSQGGEVDVSTTASIRTVGNLSHGVLAQSIGGTGGTAGLGAGAGVGALSFNMGIGGSGGSGSLGDRVIVQNGGDITTEGNSSYGISAQSIGGGGGIGGFGFGAGGSATPLFMNFSVGGSGGVGSGSGHVGVLNVGSITTMGENSHAILAQSIGGGGGITGRGDGVNRAEEYAYVYSSTVGGSGVVEGNGNTVDVTNQDSIVTLGRAAHGIYAQSIGGGGGDGGPGYTDGTNPLNEMAVIVGGTDGVRGNGAVVTVTNSNWIETSGIASMGILAQSIGGGGGSGGASAFGKSGLVALGGSGGAFGIGGPVTVQNDGDIVTYGVSGIGILAQSIGGGGGIAGNLDMGLPLGTIDLYGIAKVGDVGVGAGFARTGGAAGSGFDVYVGGAGTITTNGIGAHGILAQSIGGGGGIAGTDGTDTQGNAMTLDACRLEGCQFLVGSVGGDGAAGSVTVDLTGGGVETRGSQAHGIFAQSIAGATTGGLEDRSGNVIINLTSDGAHNLVAATGYGSAGIFAQSLGRDGSGNIDIFVGESWHVVGGSDAGIGIQIRDGAFNNLTNHGFISTAAGLGGIAVLGGYGDETIDNHFYMLGSIDLGSGLNSFNNMSQGWFDAGDTVDLGGGVFSNSGTLAPGGIANIGVTTLLGDYLQSESGHLQVDWDFSQDVADLLHVTGTASVAGQIDLGIIYNGSSVPGTDQVTILSADGGLSHTGLTLREPSSILADYDLVFPNSSDIDILHTLNFAPEELPADAAEMGSALNDIQSSGSFAGFDEIILAIFSIEDVEELDEAYEQLGGDIYGDIGLLSVVNSSLFAGNLQSCKRRDGDYRFIRQQDCRWARIDISEANRPAASSLQSLHDTSVAYGMGMQKQIGQGTHIGVGGSVARNSLEISNTLRAAGETAEIGLVAKKEIGGFLIAGIGTFGVTHSKIDRALSLLGDGIKAESKSKTTFQSGTLSVGYLVGDRRFYLVPGFELSGSFYQSPEVSERGAGAANLTVGAHNEALYKIEPMLEFGGEFENRRGTLFRPFIKAGASHYSGDTETGIEVWFTGAPAGTGLLTAESSYDKRQVNLTLGMDVLTVGGGVARLGYTGGFSDGVERHGGFVKLSFPW